MNRFLFLSFDLKIIAKKGQHAEAHYPLYRLNKYYFVVIRSRVTTEYVNGTN